MISKEMFDAILDRIETLAAKVRGQTDTIASYETAVRNLTGQINNLTDLNASRDAELKALRRHAERS